MRRHARTVRAGLALMALVAISLPAYAGEPAPADKWTFAVRPYLWAPGISGTLKYDIPPGGGGGATVDLSSYILQNLNMALMLSAVWHQAVFAQAAEQPPPVEGGRRPGPGGRPRRR